MKLKEILSISGQGGLFKYISQARNGIIVESVIDKTRTFAGTSAKISSLQDIAIFTDNDEIPLGKVLRTIKEKENGGKAVDPKLGNEELKAYMEKILPDYDREKVYVSDIKKLFNWYNLLHEHNLLDFEMDDEGEESPATEATSDDDPNRSEAAETKEKPIKPAAKKTAAVKKPAPTKGLQKTTTKAAGAKVSMPKKAI